MQLVVGLGNVGEKYKNTRHNVGYEFIDKVQRELLSDSEWFGSKKLESLVYKQSVSNVILAKPTTMMNDSGNAVRLLCDYYKVKPEDVFVAHDDLDIKLGEYKIQKGHGPKDHNGILSIEKNIGNDFWRLRIGIDNRDEQNKALGEQYVLSRMPQEEIGIVNEVLGKMVVELHEHLRQQT